MSKLLYILYALIVSLSVTSYNLNRGNGNDNSRYSSHRSWGGNSGLSGSDWYSGGHHK